MMGKFFVAILLLLNANEGRGALSGANVQPSTSASASFGWVNSALDSPADALQGKMLTDWAPTAG
jgi:hypothetical protein